MIGDGQAGAKQCQQPSELRLDRYLNQSYGFETCVVPDARLAGQPSEPQQRSNFMHSQHSGPIAPPRMRNQTVQPSTNDVNSFLWPDAWQNSLGSGLSQQYNAFAWPSDSRLAQDARAREQQPVGQLHMGVQQAQHWSGGQLQLSLDAERRRLAGLPAHKGWDATLTKQPLRPLQAPHVSPTWHRDADAAPHPQPGQSAPSQHRGMQQQYPHARQPQAATAAAAAPTPTPGPLSHWNHAASDAVHARKLELQRLEQALATVPADRLCFVHSAIQGAGGDPSGMAVLRQDPYLGHVAALLVQHQRVLHAPVASSVSLAGAAPVTRAAPRAASTSKPLPPQHEAPLDMALSDSASQSLAKRQQGKAGANAPPERRRASASAASKPASVTGTGAAASGSLASRERLREALAVTRGSCARLQAFEVRAPPAAGAHAASDPPIKAGGRAAPASAIRGNSEHGDNEGTMRPGTDVPHVVKGNAEAGATRAMDAAAAACAIWLESGRQRDSTRNHLQSMPGAVCGSPRTQQGSCLVSVTDEPSAGDGRMQTAAAAVADASGRMNPDRLSASAVVSCMSGNAGSKCSDATHMPPVESVGASAAIAPAPAAPAPAATAPVARASAFESDDEEEATLWNLAKEKIATDHEQLVASRGEVLGVTDRFTQEQRAWKRVCTCINGFGNAAAPVADTDIVPNRSRRSRSKGAPAAAASKTASIHTAIKDAENRLSRFIVRPSAIAGTGVYTAEDIQAKEILMEYRGILIRRVHEDRLEAQHEAAGHDFYIFAPDGTDLVIDATLEGNVCRFVNHSCGPNCQVTTVTAEGKKRVVLKSIKPIRSGEELTYDYRLKYDPNKAMLCRCGSKRCRVWL